MTEPICLESVYRKTAATTFHCLEGGKGPLMLLVHGWNNDSSGFGPFLEELRGYRIMAVDLPGYGGSGILDPDTYSIQIMADALHELLEQLPAPPVVICSLSMGSAVVCDMLCRYPGCTDRAVLMGAPVVPYRKLGPQISRAFLTFMGNHPRCQPLGKRLLATRLYGHLVARFLNMYRYDRALVDRCGLTGRRAIKPRTLFEMGKSVTNYDLVGSLGRLTVPTRLIYGHQDGIVDHQKISELVQKNPALSLAYVENAGHVVSLEKPAETARILWLQDQS